MSRLERLRPEDMTPEQRAFAGLFTSGRRAAPDAAFRLADDDGVLQGPPAAWVLQPSLGTALQHLGGEVRFGLSLPDRAAEAVVLAVAEHEGSPFEIFAHVRAAERAGWTAEDIAVIRAGGEPSGADETELCALRTGRALLAGGLDDDTFADAVEGLGGGAVGREHLFELSTLVGYYRMVAGQLRLFGIEPPAE